MGNFWLIQANHVRAYDYYLQAEAIAKELNDSSLIGNTLKNRASSTQQMNEKIELYLEALTVFTGIKDTFNLASVHLNLGNAYAENWAVRISDSSETGDNPNNLTFYKESAFKHYAEAENLSKTLQDTVVEGMINVHYAKWCQYEKDYEEAKKLFYKADSLMEKGLFPKGQTTCCLCKPMKQFLR